MLKVLSIPALVFINNLFYFQQRGILHFSLVNMFIVAITWTGKDGIFIKRFDAPCQFCCIAFKLRYSFSLPVSAAPFLYIVFTWCRTSHALPKWKCLALFQLIWIDLKTMKSFVRKICVIIFVYYFKWYLLFRLSKTFCNSDAIFKIVQLGLFFPSVV